MATGTTSSTLEIGTTFTPSFLLSIGASGTLGLSSSASGTIIQNGVISGTLGLSSSAQAFARYAADVLSQLGLSSSASSVFTVRVDTRSVLWLSDSVSRPQPDRTQYSVSLDTGAAAEYDGFDFAGYARGDNGTYAYADGKVYRLRPGTDDGAAVTASIDFGTVPLASSTEDNHIEDIFFGVDTDGVISAVLNVDGVEYEYPVITRGELIRAVLSRSVRGRSWNVSIRTTDATHFYLESVELHVGGTARWHTSRK